MRDIAGTWFGSLCVTIPLVIGTSLAQAQVIRCTDPVTGSISYTDDTCAPGAYTTEIERRLTPEEQAQQQARTDEALRAKAERQKEEREQRREQEMQALRNQIAASPPTAPHHDQEQTESETPVPAFILNNRHRYIHHGKPPAFMPSAPAITHCDVFKCVDAQGYTHPRGAIGETPRPVTPSTPRTCHSRGGSAPC